jgi:hypothetical protein
VNISLLKLRSEKFNDDDDDDDDDDDNNNNNNLSQLRSAAITHMKLMKKCS